MPLPRSVKGLEQIKEDTSQTLLSLFVVTSDRQVTEKSDGILCDAY